VHPLNYIAYVSDIYCNCIVFLKTFVMSQDIKLLYRFYYHLVDIADRVIDGVWSCLSGFFGGFLSRLFRFGNFGCLVLKNMGKSNKKQI